MTKSELEKKPLSDLHSLAAEAGVERYRMLTKAELVAKLADGDAGDGSGGDSGEGSGSARAPRSGRSRSGSGSGRGRSTSGAGRTGTDAGEGRSERSGGGRSGSGDGRSGGSGEGRSGEDGERPRRRRRRSGSGSGGSGSGSGSGGSGSGTSAGRERELAHEDTEEEGTERVPETPPRERAPEPAAASAAADSGDEGSRPKRRRRRRRFGRRKDGVSIQDLLLPPESGRQAVVIGETRAACTALLRGIAADLAGDSKGPDPVALLIDPTPEELADWKREAPEAEIVSAGQARHATDALALAKNRAASEDVILLVDSLTRLAEEFGDTDTAKDFFDAGQNVSGTGSLTVVAALERSAD